MPTTSGLLPFSTPAAVTLTVFDVQGRRLAMALSRSPLASGLHVLPVVTSSWRAGCYLAQLEVNGAATTSKLVIVRQSR